MNSQKLSFKIGILSISVLTMAAASISATLPFLLKALPQVAAANVSMLLSVPSFGILLFVFLGPLFIRFLGAKPTVITGLIIATVAGIIPFFTLNYPVLLVSRFLLGCGIGMFNSLAYSLITINYEGDERNKMIGYQGVVSGVGDALLQLLVGFIMAVNWRASFLIFLVCLIPLLLFIFFVPKEAAQSKEMAETAAPAAQSGHFTKSMFAYAIEAFFVFAAYMTVVYNFASLVVTKGFGSASSASMILSLVTLVGLLSGLTFGKVFGKFTQWTAPLSFLLMGIMLVGLALSNSFVLSAIFAVLSGFFFAYGQPAIFAGLASTLDGPSQNLGSTVLLIGINLGVFLNPTILSIISKIFNNSSVEFLMLSASVILLIIAVLHGLVVTQHQNSHHQHLTKGEI